MKRTKREKIARLLVHFENKKWDDIEDKTIRFMQDNSKEVYLRRADIILKKLWHG